METRTFRIYKLLYPLALLYGIGVRLRNLLFDKGVLRTRSFPLPIICVGNLTVGGTGKTPHTEYLIRLLLQKGYRVGVLSRGYKRRSKGFVWGEENATTEEIGDEPFQMKSKFSNVRLAVDSNRCRGIEQMTQPDTCHNIEVILLDDAYQHRYVKAGCNILLTDYHRPIYLDALLPAGRLREPFNGRLRAEIVIVTKCPASLSVQTATAMRQQLQLTPRQQLFFSTVHYGHLIPIATYPQSETQTRPLESLRHCQRIFLLTGIASPMKLKTDLSAYVAQIEMLSFPDHHAFNKEDIKLINRKFQSASTDSPVITTEKDATRLLHLPLDSNIRRNLYVLPIEIHFLFKQETIFNQTILNYVETYSRNSKLPE